MPHDRNGKLLEVGDLVLIEARIETITPAEDYCNLTVKTVLPMPPYDSGTSITLNTRQVSKAETEAEAKE